MDRAPLPIPDGLIQIWIQYEYRKRNSIEVTQKSICEAVFSPDDETARLVTAAWQPALDPDPEPNAEKVMPNPEGEDPEVEAEEDSEEDNPDVETTPDNSFIRLNDISDFEADEEEPKVSEPPEEKEIPVKEREQLLREHMAAAKDRLQCWRSDVMWKAIRDHGHRLPRVLRFRDSCSQEGTKALYKKFAHNEIKIFGKKRGSLMDADIIQLLACRKNCEKDEKVLLDKIKLPIKKMKIVTDYWKTKVEIYRDPESEKHLNFQFWRHDEGCLLWTDGENVRLIRKEAYQEVAAEYVVTIMKHPKMRFKEMIFDIEPWYKGPAEFPNMEFYTQLRRKLDSALDKKKVKVRHLFMRSCFSNYQVDQWSAIVPYLRRKWLKLITLRIWDDKHVDQREKEKRPYFDFLPQPEKALTENEGNGMQKAWKSATHLDYRDENLRKHPFDCTPINWVPLTTFRRIRLLEVHWEAFDDIIDIFKMFPPQQRCTISVEKNLNLKEIKWYFTTNKDLDLSQGFAMFQSDNERSITIKLQDKKIIIDTEWVPDQELDDNDPADTSSDESCAE